MSLNFFSIRHVVAFALVSVTFPAIFPAHAADDSTLRRLEERVKRLEVRNAELEKSLEDDHVSEKEPEITARLKAVEFQALGMQRQARMIESLEGITAGISFTTVAQSASKYATVDDSGESQLNYRGDAAVTLPGGTFGNAEGRIFGQFRLGQGRGLSSLRPTFSGVNTTAFQLDGVSHADDSVALLAQLWYQADIPLPFDGHKPESRQQLTINFGKMDPFIFFDQNTVANDETRQFLNNVFVHNALLDAGGDIGADAYGFQPGLRVAYVNEKQKPLTYGISLGIFGAGNGAHFENSFSSPFAILQLETHQKFFGGLDGNYRVYTWRNGQATPYSNSAEADIEKHAGWGVSLDQRVFDAITLFARVGHETKGNVQFDRVVSAGAEFGGSYWDRAGDAIGLGAASMRPSKSYRENAATLDADGDGNPDFGYTVDESEQVLEIYYRYRLQKQLEFSPSVQAIRQPGGNSSARDMRIIGLRGQVTF